MARKMPSAAKRDTYVNPPASHRMHGNEEMRLATDNDRANSKHDPSTVSPLRERKPRKKAMRRQKGQGDK